MPLLAPPVFSPLERRLLWLTGVGIALVGVTTLAGWLGGWPRLAVWLDDGSPMAVSTAGCMIVAAAALGLLAAGWTRSAQVCGLLVGGFAVLTLANRMIGGEAFTPGLLSASSPAFLGEPLGRMVSGTATALTLVGIAITVLPLPSRTSRIVLIAAGVGVLTIVTVPSLGYLANISEHPNVYRGMALPTVVCFVALALVFLRRASPTGGEADDHLPPLMTASLSLLLALGGLAVTTNAELVASSRRVVQAEEILADIERVVARVARMETNARGYAITGAERAREATLNHGRVLLQMIAQLRARVTDDPPQEERVAQLLEQAREKIAYHESVVAARQAGGTLEAALPLILAPGPAVANGLIALGNTMKAHETERLDRWQTEMNYLARSTRAIQGVGSLVALSLVGLTIAQTRRSRRRRRAAEAATQAANLALNQRVAELAAARTELEAAHRRQAAVLDGTVLAVISTTPDGVIASFNAGAERMLGYRREEMVGRAALPALHLTAELVTRAVELAHQLGHPVEPGSEVLLARARLGQFDEREWTFVRKDGTRLPVLLGVNPLRDAAGTVTGFIAIAQDLTDRKRAELSLRATEEQLGEVLRHADCLVWEARVHLGDAESAWRTTVYSSGLHRRLHGGDPPRGERGRWDRFEIPERVEMGERARDAMQRGLPGYVQEFRLLLAGQTIWLRESVAIVPQGLGRFWLIGVATDITEEKRAEAARSELLERLQKIGRQVPGMIYQFRLRPDGSSCFPYSSDGIRDIYRVSPEDVREDASRVFGILHPDDLAAVRESILVSARTQQNWRHEYRVLDPDGTERWLLGNAVPERESDGSVLWHGFITDITARRRVERALEEQEARLRLVLDEMPIGVRWVRHCDGRHEVVLNPAFESITGISAAEHDQPGIDLARTHPDDIAAQRSGHDRLQRDELRQFTLEKRYLKADGAVTWVTITWLRRPLPGAGNYEELCTLKDITERKEAELELRATLRQVSQLKASLDAFALVLITDLEGRITHVNERFCAVSGFRPDELLGRRPPGLEAGAHPPEFFEAIGATVSRGEIWRGEMRNFAKDGSEYWAATAIVPGLDESGRPFNYVAIQIDITERKRLEERLAQARDQALEASRLKSDFLATISHEIRTPMNAVIGMAGLLAETPLEPEQDEMTRTILGGAENLLVLIDDILDFSRVEAGRLRLDSADFDFRRVVEQTVQFLGRRAEEKGLAVTCEFASTPSSLVHGDAGRVRQVLTNLLGNAIKFTDAGAVTVQTRVVAESAARVRLRVSVRDTGIGIAPESRRLLFQPFTQVDGSARRRFGGTGLGLAISRQLVQLMGGEIGVESALGTGSEFWFELEFVRGGPLAPAVAKAPAAAATPPSRGGKRLLVAEDNPANQRVARLLLSRMGYEVIIAEDGFQALTLLAGQRFDAVLMDCQMPGLDGLDAARRIRAGAVPGIDPGVPIIALTAYARAEDRARCLDAGMNDHVAKPIRPAELRGALVRCGVAPAEVPRAPAPGGGGEVLDEEALATARSLPGATGPSLLPELVRLYLADDAERLERLDRLAAERRGTELADEVHGFGGNAAALGGSEVRRVALEVEAAARAGDWDQVALRLQRLHDAGARLRHEIDRRRLATA